MRSHFVPLSAAEVRMASMNVSVPARCTRCVMKLVFTPNAQRDLQEIDDYIAQDNPLRATLIAC
jgi:hypothetical protein